MRELAVIIISLGIAVFATNALAQKKRDDFRYREKSGTFQTKEDWFGKSDRTRKQMEDERDSQMRNAQARDEEVVANIEAASRSEMRTGKDRLLEQKKEFKSQFHPEPVTNAEIQQQKDAIRDRGVDFPREENKEAVSPGQ